MQEDFLKRVLVETVNGMTVDYEQWSEKAEINIELLRLYADPLSNSIPSKSEYLRLMIALPNSVCAEIASLKTQSANSLDTEDVITELEFAEGVAGLLGQNCSDEQMPLFVGLQRQLRRIRDMF